MKTLLTLLLISICSIGFGQPSIVVTDDIRLNQLGLNRKIILSKGEQFTEKEWQEYSKQMLPYVKQYFLRDSTHRKFLENTIKPWLSPGDTLESWSITDKEINLKFKPKKK